MLSEELLVRLTMQHDELVIGIEDDQSDEQATVHINAGELKIIIEDANDDNRTIHLADNLTFDG
ncbi:hypothetical protein [Natronococcus roseus]|uniref:hypothetical protein n=1 Tax=Natronococcus roseus TaxID=1052014 RepID=UPI00374D7D46